uniref:PHD-type zinc finger plants domain-containing protein n=1 Tax=Leersia perrieri TaxID=77586 RepID=A0A0D9VQH7_9ORYZ
MGSDKSSAGSAAGSSSQPPAAAATSAVCCMCGDRGLLPELFRCAACAVRSQHTYCTDRYPKAESYGTCNWCLRSDGSVTTTSSSARLSTVRSVAAAGGAADPARSAAAAAKVVAARGHFAADLSKPIKKPPPAPAPSPSPQQRRILLRRSASDLGGRVRGGEHDAPPPPSPGVARGRPRVRRYKLLEEVITTS